jgi:hypothetical protein
MGMGITGNDLSMLLFSFVVSTRSDMLVWMQ